MDAHGFIRRMTDAQLGIGSFVLAIPILRSVTNEISLQKTHFECKSSLLQVIETAKLFVNFDESKYVVV